MYISAIQEKNGHSGKQGSSMQPALTITWKGPFFYSSSLCFSFCPPPFFFFSFTLPFSINADDCFLMKHLWLSGLCLSLRRRSSALGRAHHIPSPRLWAVVQIRKQEVQVRLTFSAEGIAGGWMKEKERLIGKEVLSLKLRRQNLEQDWCISENSTSAKKQLFHSGKIQWRPSLYKML